jgi:hypothetical protein
VVSRDLVVFGQDVVERLAQECAAGGRTTRLQLLASPFYEALKREIGRTHAREVEKRRALAAAADQCRRAADCSIAPPNIVVELRAAVATLGGERALSFKAPPGARPQLRIIRGGLA